MRHVVRMALAIVCVGAMAGQARAQNQGRNDQLNRYYNFYLNQQNSQRLTQQQQQYNTDYQQFSQSYQSLANTSDPIEMYARQGRESSAQGRRLPPMYSGAMVRRQYFQRNYQFNPPRYMGRTNPKH